MNGSHFTRLVVSKFGKKTEYYVFLDYVIACDTYYESFSGNSKKIMNGCQVRLGRYYDASFTRLYVYTFYVVYEKEWVYIYIYIIRLLTLHESLMYIQ